MVWLCYTLTYTKLFYISMMKQPQIEDYVFENGLGADAYWNDYKKWSDLMTLQENEKQIMSEFDISEKDWKATPKDVKLSMVRLWKEWAKAEEGLQDVRLWIEELPI